jgi:exodeoxyribonuclease-3
MVGKLQETPCMLAGIRWPRGMCAKTDMSCGNGRLGEGEQSQALGLAARDQKDGGHSLLLQTKGFLCPSLRMKLVSWNVNGVRAALRKGLLEFMESSNADIICFQEAKAHPGDVQHIVWPRGYDMYWNPASKKGYSGTVVFTRPKPVNVSHGIGLPDHDGEGRVITLEFPDYHLLNVYQPNSQRGLTRLAYRTQEWDPAFLGYVRKLDGKKPVIFCGDLNVAHAEIDLANPKTNRRNAGFTDEERANFSALLASGFVDTFREFEKGPGHHTWWSQMANCRARNIGWRVDYFVASERLRPSLKAAYIRPDVMGSDHCPVVLELK